MSYRQTRIFVPTAIPFDHDQFWVETLVAHVIAPVVAAFPTIEWFWFSRYAATSEDSGDCDISVIPEEFAVGPWKIYRSLRFRYSVPDVEREALEAQCLNLIESLGCRISDVRDYDPIADLATERFLGGVITPERRAARAQYMTQFLCATCQLFMHTLAGPDPDGRYRAEPNSERSNNPHGNTFESVHHLFCNILDPPLHILVAEPIIGTNVYRAEGIPVREVKVRF